MEHKHLGGLLSALITPFYEDGTLDLRSFQALISSIDMYHDGYLIGGSTGQGNMLTLYDKVRLVHTARSVVGKKPIIVGTGGNDQEEIFDTFSVLRDHADAFLLSSPVYTKLDQQDLFVWFDEIFSSPLLQLPIILYNIPGRTGNHIENKTIGKLANKHECLIGVKGASADLENEQRLCQLMMGHGRGYWLGDDPRLLEFGSHKSYISGLISVLSQAIPDEVRELLKEADPAPQTEVLFRGYCDIVLNGPFKNPKGITACLATQGQCKRYLRKPIRHLEKSDVAWMKSRIDSTPALMGDGDVILDE